jgi:aryl-alcohol dehydrogenase-like predicted oxidoreductase
MANSYGAVQSFNTRAPIARLGLGSVQFGQRYGATNRHPPPGRRELAAILERASAAGVGWIDTAPDYGEAERMLGLALAATPGFRIVTKVPSLEAVPTGAAGASVRASVGRSLERLGAGAVDALLLHRARDLSRPDWPDVAAALRSLKGEGLVRRIGVSIYDPDELALAIERLSPDIVQLPLNPMDRRFSGVALRRRLGERGIAVHARSLFLQGLLVAEPGRLPGFAGAHPALQAWRRWLGGRGLSALAACLAFALSVPEVEVALVGIAAMDELEEILGALSTLPAALDFGDLPAGDRDLIDPRRWPPR